MFIFFYYPTTIRLIFIFTKQEGSVKTTSGFLTGTSFYMLWFIFIWYTACSLLISTTWVSYRCWIFVVLTNQFPSSGFPWFCYLNDVCVIDFSWGSSLHKVVRDSVYTFTCLLEKDAQYFVPSQFRSTFRTYALFKDSVECAR